MRKRRPRIVKCEYVLNDNKMAEISFFYNNGSNEKKIYTYVDEVYVDSSNPRVKMDGLLIKSLKFDNEYAGNIAIENCVVIDDVDTEFAYFRGAVSYRKTVFLGNCELTGDYDSICSFEETTFLGKRVSFNESNFGFVDFQMMYAQNSNINFYKTKICNEEFPFNDTEFVNTPVKFEETVFEHVRLMNFTAVSSDDEVRFNRVSFDCMELRWFGSEIARLSFITCEFQCNIADFEMDCEFLILHEGINTKIMNFQNLRSLKKLDICEFVNLGRINWVYSAQETISFLSKKEPIVWGEKGELHIANHRELEYEYKQIKDIYAATMQYDNMDKMYSSMCLEKRKGDFEEKRDLHKAGKINWLTYFFYRLKHGIIDCFIEDFMSCYATSIKRVLFMIVSLVCIFGLVYAPVIVSDSTKSFLSRIWGGLYYSGITFFTIGYSEVDFAFPIMKAVSIMEGFCGVFLMSYLTAVFIRKLAR